MGWVQNVVFWCTQCFVLLLMWHSVFPTLKRNCVIFLFQSKSSSNSNCTFSQHASL